MLESRFKPPHALTISRLLAMNDIPVAANGRGGVRATGLKVVVVTAEYESERVSAHIADAAEEILVINGYNAQRDGTRVIVRK